MTFLQNKKILNLCFGWHILRSYRFVAEVIFNEMLQNYCHVTCVESLGSWKLLATLLNKKAYKMKLQCTHVCGDVKQRLYYFYNFFYENRQVIR